MSAKQKRKANHCSVLMPLPVLYATNPPTENRFSASSQWNRELTFTSRTWRSFSHEAQGYEGGKAGGLTLKQKQLWARVLLQHKVDTSFIFLCLVSCLCSTGRKSNHENTGEIRLHRISLCTEKGGCVAFWRTTISLHHTCYTSDDITSYTTSGFFGISSHIKL